MASTLQILTNLGFYDKLNEGKKITFGTNTTEVTTQVAEGAVDAGIVFGLMWPPPSTRKA